MSPENPSGPRQPGRSVLLVEDSPDGREALRALLLANNGVAAEPRRLAPLERAARAGRLTLQIGVRYDRNHDQALASSVAASPLMPTLLPAVSFAGADPRVIFNNFCCSTIRSASSSWSGMPRRCPTVRRRACTVGSRRRRGFSSSSGSP